MRGQNKFFKGAGVQKVEKPCLAHHLQSYLLPSFQKSTSWRRKIIFKF